MVILPKGGKKAYMYMLYETFTRGINLTIFLSHIDYVVL